MRLLDVAIGTVILLTVLLMIPIVFDVWRRVLFGCKPCATRTTRMDVPLNRMMVLINRHRISIRFKPVVPGMRFVTNLSQKRCPQWIIYRAAYLTNEKVKLLPDAYDIDGKRCSDALYAMYNTLPHHDLSKFWRLVSTIQKRYGYIS